MVARAGTDAHAALRGALLLGALPAIDVVGVVVLGEAAPDELGHGAGRVIAHAGTDVRAALGLAAFRRALPALHLVLIVVVVLGQTAASLAGLWTRVRVARACTDHHAVPGLAPVGADELAVVLVFVLVEHAAPNPVIVIAIPVLVHAGRRAHADGLGSGIDTEELILRARARTEARATVARGVRRERADAHAADGHLVGGRGVELPDDHGERGVQALVQSPGEHRRPTAPAGGGVRRRELHADARRCPDLGPGGCQDNGHGREERHGAPLDPDRCHAPPSSAASQRL